jgi:hypothetical protein
MSTNGRFMVCKACLRTDGGRVPLVEKASSGVA